MRRALALCLVLASSAALAEERPRLRAVLVAGFAAVGAAAAIAFSRGIWIA